MPRYLVQRSFTEGLHIPIDGQGAQTCASVIATNAGEGVTWLHSYVSDDLRTTFCVYDGPDPEAIRAVAARNGLPVESVTQVRVLDPYFYAPPGCCCERRAVAGRPHRGGRGACHCRCGADRSLECLRRGLPGTSAGAPVLPGRPGRPAQGGDDLPAGPAVLITSEPVPHLRAEPVLPRPTSATIERCCWRGRTHSRR